MQRHNEALFTPAFAVMLMLGLHPSSATGEQPLTPEQKVPFVMHDFASDLILKFEDGGPAHGPHSKKLEKKDLTVSEQASFKALRHQDRKTVNKLWRENGGITQSEHLLREKIEGADFLGVRIIWKPAQMPDAVFADPTKRVEWLYKHLPDPAPDDIAMKISAPFRTKFYLD